MVLEHSTLSSSMIWAPEARYRYLFRLLDCPGSTASSWLGVRAREFRVSFGTNRITPEYAMSHSQDFASGHTKPQAQ